MNELERLPTWVQRSLAWGLLLLLLIVAWKLFDGYYLQRLQADIGQLQQEQRKKQRVDAILARGKAVQALQERMAGQSVQALYLKMAHRQRPRHCKNGSRPWSSPRAGRAS